MRQSRNLTFAHIGTYTVFSAEANIRRTRGTSQDKITTKASHSHKAHGGHEEPQAVSKMAVYHFRSQKSAFRREKFVRSDFFPLKRKNRLSRSSGQIGRISRGVSGIRLKGGWTFEHARVKIARILSAKAEYWSRMPSVRWPLGAMCRDLGRCSWPTTFAGGLFLFPTPHPTPHPTPGHRPTPTSLPPASSKHTVRPCRGDYRYRPARHHVTMLWRDSTQCVGKA